MKKVTLIGAVTALTLMMAAVGTGSFGMGYEDKVPEEPVSLENPRETPENEIAVKPLGERPATGWVFGFSSIGTEYDYYSELEKLLRGYIRQADDAIITMHPGDDAKLQAEQLRKMADRGVDAIFLNPVDIKELETVLLELEEKGIPVINMNQDAAGIKSEITVVDSDNFNSGFLLGEYMVTKGIPGRDVFHKTKAVIVAEENHMHEKGSIYGFRAAVGDSFFRVERELYCSHEKEMLRTELKKAVDEIEDLIYVLSLCDEMTRSILEICEEEGYDELRVFTIGGSPEIKKMMAEGNKNLEAIVAKSPASLAMNAYAIMMQYLAGREIKKEYLIETFLITKENIQNFNTEIWQ